MRTIRLPPWRGIDGKQRNHASKGFELGRYQARLLGILGFFVSKKFLRKTFASLKDQSTVGIPLRRMHSMIPCQLQCG
jgi:hypothetical protein